MAYCRPLISTVAGVSLLAAGCGGGSPRSTGAATPTGAAAPTQTGALAFARCVRAHGLPNWPDPTRSGNFDKHQLERLGYSESRVRAAQAPCAHLLPPQETVQQRRVRLADALAFARCVRARGFPSFPDPTDQGELTSEMVTAAGIDLHQPQLLRAGLACVPVTHGLLTRAAIERAVNGG